MKGRLDGLQGDGRRGVERYGRVKGYGRVNGRVEVFEGGVEGDEDSGRVKKGDVGIES